MKPSLNYDFGRMGRFNPPDPKTYRPRNYDMDQRAVADLRARLESLRPGDTVQLHTREDRGRHAAFFAVGVVLHNGAKYADMLDRKPKQKWTDADHKFIEGFLLHPNFSPLRELELETLHADGEARDISLVRPQSIVSIRRFAEARA